MLELPTVVRSQGEEADSSKFTNLLYVNDYNNVNVSPPDPRMPIVVGRYHSWTAEAIFVLATPGVGMKNKKKVLQKVLKYFKKNIAFFEVLK